MVEITLAGTMRLAAGGRVVAERALGGRNARVALAVLVLERSRPLTRDELADRLWPDSLPPTWQSMLRTVVAGLRKAFGALGPDAGVVLRAEVSHYQLWLPPGSRVDIEDAEGQVVAAEALFDAGAYGDARDAAQQAGAALAPPFLAGADAQWIDRERARLGDLAVRALEAGAAAALAEGDHAGCATTAESAITQAPYRESAYRLLMQAHWASGSRGEALRAYERCRQRLSDDLGVDPSPLTEELYVSLLGAEPLEYATGRPGQLPVMEATMVGREDDLERVGALLSSGRLVTVLGFGGVGKTRLVAAVASTARDRYAGGVYWVDLATAGADGVAHTVLRAVGMARQGQDPLDTAVDLLRPRHALVVFDNCEHVIEAAAAAVLALLGGCPQLRILATSRTPLGVAGEHVAPLEPLAEPDAIDLFTQRAVAGGADLASIANTPSTVAEICRRLDGLPLAIELAAARARSIGPAQIAGHLDQRFELLQSRGRGDPPRHQSLDAAVRWSYDLLTPHHQRAFRRLSVLTGTFSMDAGCALVANGEGEAGRVALLDLLADLVDQSMVTPAATGDEPRYQLLETLREYGRLRLDEAGETADAQERHASYFLQLVEAAAVGLQGAEEQRWVRTLNDELPNVLSAFAHTASSVDVDRSLRFAIALFDYAFHRMRVEIANLANEAVSLPGADAHPLYGAACAVAGYLAWERGSLDDTNRHLHAARNDDSWISTNARATVALFQGDLEAAIDGYERSADHAARQDNAFLRAISLSQQSFAHVLAGLESAVSLAEASRIAADECGSPTALAQASWALGLAHFDGDPLAALDHLDRAIALAHEVDNNMAVGASSDPAEALRTKVTRRSATDDLRAAIDQFEYWVRQGNPPNVWAVLRRVVRQLAALGMHQDAALFAGAEQAAALKVPARQRERQRHRQVVDEVRQSMSPEEYELLTASGAALSDVELLRELRRAAAAAQPVS